MNNYFVNVKISVRADNKKDVIEMLEETNVLLDEQKFPLDILTNNIDEKDIIVQK